MDKLKILVIENDEHTAEVVSLVLRLRWPKGRLILTQRGLEGIEIIQRELPDVVILDLDLPDISGFEVLKRIRLFSTVPIAILAAGEEENEIVRSLNGGADEYIIKPFRWMEFLARLKALVWRRRHPYMPGSHICGKLGITGSLDSLHYDGAAMQLTKNEGLLLYALMKNTGKVVTYSSLVKVLWGEDYPKAVVTLRTHIRMLRAKIEKDPDCHAMILTKKNIGYTLVPHVFDKIEGSFEGRERNGEKEPPGA